MTRRSELARELGDLSEERHVLCRAAIRQLEEAIAAVDDVRLGIPGAVERLAALCRHVPYEGAVLALRLDDLIDAETQRRQCEAELEELDGADVA